MRVAVVVGFVDADGFAVIVGRESTEGRAVIVGRGSGLGFAVIVGLGLAASDFTQRPSMKSKYSGAMHCLTVVFVPACAHA